MGEGEEESQMIYILGIGSNLKSKYGSKIQTLKFIIRELERSNIRILKKSYIYSSPPKYFKKAADTFVNAALMVSSEQSPKKLICSLKRIEKSTGRYVYQKNSSRTCDLDILLSKPDGKHVIENGKYNLIIPHPKICDRKFVLKPLNDICPNWQHFDYKQNILSLNRDSKIKDNIYRLRQTL